MHVSQNVKHELFFSWSAVRLIVIPNRVFHYGEMNVANRISGRNKKLRRLSTMTITILITNSTPRNV